MPSLDDLIGRAPLSAATSTPGLTPVVDPELPTYELLRPHIRPSLFEALRPHVEEFERRMALRNQAARSDTAALNWAASPADHAASPYGAPETAPEPSSYEDLRPYLRPSLFEALKPHVAAFEKAMALRNASMTSSSAAPPTDPTRASYEAPWSVIQPTLGVPKPHVAPLEPSERLRANTSSPQSFADASTWPVSYELPDRLGWRAPPPAQKFLGPVPGIGGEPGNEPPAGPTDTLPTRLVSDPEVMSDADPPIWSPWARYATRLRRAPRGPGGRELSPMEEVHTALYESAHATLRRLDPTNPQLTTYSNLNSVPTTRDIGRLNEEIRRNSGKQLILP